MEEVDPEESATLLVVREVAVFKIPPRTSSAGYKCGEWLQSDKIWSGRLRLVSTSRLRCEVRLEDSNSGELFAACPVEAGNRDATVESVLDSSRYFVLQVDDGRGRHAFLGLGFSERSDAFDFNVALSDFEKHTRLSTTHASAGGSPAGSLDLRLKEGETIKINVKKGIAGLGSGMTKASPSSSATGTATPLAPPPGRGRLRSPLPPPPSDTRIKPPLSDLSQLQASSDSKTNAKGRGAGWAAF